MDALKKHIRAVCDQQFLVCAEEEDQEMTSSGSGQPSTGAGISSDWSDKILQLYQITQLNHGMAFSVSFVCDKLGLICELRQRVVGGSFGFITYHYMDVCLS